MNTKERKNDKKIEVMAVILLILVSIIVISYFIFRIKKVEFEIISSPVYAMEVEGLQEELEKLYINESFLYFSTSACKLQLEKNHPYCTVQSITRIFPSTLKIKLVERFELFAIEEEAGFLICDEEGKVFRIASDAQSNRNTRLIIAKNMKSGQEKFFKMLIDALVDGGYIQNKLQSNLVASLDFEGENLKIIFSSGTSVTIEKFENNAKDAFEFLFAEFFDTNFDRIGSNFFIRFENDKFIIDKQ